MGLNTALIALAIGVLLWFEQRWPLRRRRESTAQRTARNFTVAGLSALAVRCVELPVVLPLSVAVEQHGWGILGIAPLPAWASVAIALILMDYTLYIWHVLTHRVSWLWRFHVVHHIDRDMDASTALRFHFAEMVVSVPWRAAQVVVIGVSPVALGLWQSVLFLSILFHHSNLRLPIALERRLNRLVVTPRMHGIHHSIVRPETDSNWSSGLTVWDWLHGTLRLNVPQGEIVIGVPAYQQPADTTLPVMLGLPFRRQPPSWSLSSGEQPARPEPDAPRSLLLA